MLAPLGYGRVNDLESSSGYGPDRAHDAFHRAALEAGAIDEGAPGPRPQYHAHYYAAYAVDPDGNRIEAVCHRPPEEDRGG